MGTIDLERKLNCGICGGETVLIHKGTRDRPDINVYECKKCRTKQLDYVGGNDYENGFMNGGRDLNLEEISRRIEACRNDDIRRAEMVYEYCKDKDVLDFGCGFGGFLREISGIARTVSGVEAGRCERSYLNSLGFKVEKDINAYKQQFDVITLFHVFEHLPEPHKWLKIFADSLRLGGLLFIEVPNANDALLSLYKCQAFADFTYWSAHLYLYTEESLRKLIEGNSSWIIESAEQIQRYPLSNHLYWLAFGKSGGHVKWDFLNSEELDSAYKHVLGEQKMCDTLFFRVRRI